MAKILISLSILFLTLSAVFGVLNTNNARVLRQLSDKNQAARVEAERLRLAKEKDGEKGETAAQAVLAKHTDFETKIAGAEAELIRTRTEKAEIQARLQEDQKEIAQLQRRLEEAGSREVVPETLPMPGAGDLQAQLEDTRRQLDNAERDKQRLSQRVQKTENRSAQTPALRVARPPRPEVRGTVLAVNQAYNFVVLNLGGRQGLEPNSEMFVMRGGTIIGKIRVSSVEPATAIGDIIKNSLARGVQVQPGDIVVYAGSSS